MAQKQSEQKKKVLSFINNLPYMENHLVFSTGHSPASYATSFLKHLYIPGPSG